MPRGNGHDPDSELVEPLKALPVASWAEQEPPERKWMVPGMLPVGNVCLLTSEGGLGKSLLMMQLQCCTALGKPWLGRQVPQVASIGYYCEDDPAELQRRLRACANHYETNEAELAEHLELYSRAGKETVLMRFDQSTNRRSDTPLYDQLMRATEDIGAQIVIIDTTADTFEGNENIRSQVRQYVNQLRRFALATEGGVMLLAHPSNAGISSGSGLSGSTAWHNTVRGRAYLTKPKKNGQDEDDEGDNNRRVLQFMKSNYSDLGNKINLLWQEGVFVLADHPGALDMVEKLEMNAHVIEAVSRLVRDGIKLALDPRSVNNAAKILRTKNGLGDYSPRQVENCIAKLLDDNKLLRVECGTPSKRQVRIRTPESRYADEVPQA